MKNELNYPQTILNQLSEAQIRKLELGKGILRRCEKCRKYFIASNVYVLRCNYCGGQKKKCLQKVFKKYEYKK